VTDCAGNNTVYTQIVIVEDTTPPTGTVPEDITLQNLLDIPPIDPAVVTDPRDNCSETVTVAVDETNNGGSSCQGDPFIITRIFTLSDCAGNATSLTQTITIVDNDAVPQLTATSCNEDQEKPNLDLFDFAPRDIPRDGTWRNTNGNIDINGSLIRLLGLLAGDYTFEYFRKEEVCPSLALNLTVIDNCRVIECGPILVHNAFSPNGDNINEKFVIDNIDNITCYPDNTVQIYNRWGVLVYETRNYNNTTNAFDGVSQGRTTIDQAAGLPTGTYFYVLSYTSVDTNGAAHSNSKSGYLFLSR
jgi:gliding motility-associated-like protein